ncbi:hypothetical protein [Neptunomonas sp.]|uniref:hypothetical protein n=1 Tax=Neptunomonas sp. TaxID=1971898 RepID=UPI0025DC5346|nr:hypothetical protein [Neptunomonas sp.]
MTKYFLSILLLPFFFLIGCQPLPKMVPLTEKPLPNCFLTEEALSIFLEDEHQYMMSNAAQRKQILLSVKASPERLANILSNERNNKTALEKSLPLFNQLPLLPNKSCTADRYLYLRFRHAQANLAAIEDKSAISARLNTAKLTIEKQQQQIDALTQIEHAITRQREEP